MDITTLQPWKRLERLAQAEKQYASSVLRPAPHLYRVGPLHISMHQPALVSEIKHALLDLAYQTNVIKMLGTILDFENPQEAYPHLVYRHIANSETLKKSHPKTKESLDKMKEIYKKYKPEMGNSITDIIHVGVGGSYTGVKFVIDSLKNSAPTKTKIHFINHIDGQQLERLKNKLNKENTLIIIASKSFLTKETIINATEIKNWFGNDSLFFKNTISVTAKPDLASKFGCCEANILPLHKSISGRFSIWSPMYITALLKLGESSYEQLLEGGRLIDEHLTKTPTDKNPILLMALCDLYEASFKDTRTHAIIAYNQELFPFTTYARQLIMESLGKNLTNRGKQVKYNTAPAVLCCEGINAVHSVHQHFYQGTQTPSADYLIALENEQVTTNTNLYNLSSCLGQISDSHLSTNTIFIDGITPKSVGALMALYESRTIVLGLLWQLNVFDQPGADFAKHKGDCVYKKLKKIRNKVSLKKPDFFQELIESI